MNCETCKHAEIHSDVHVIEGTNITVIQNGHMNITCINHGYMAINLKDDEMICSAYERKES